MFPGALTGLKAGGLIARHWPKVVVAIVVLGLLAWGVRLDGLRSGYRDQAAGFRAQLIAAADAVVIAIGGRPPKFDQIDDRIGDIAGARDAARRERDSARRALDEQSEGIRRLQAEGQRLQAVSEKNKRLAEAMADERRVRIDRARRAETRDQRQACEQELEEIDAVLDLLYRSGF